MINEYILALRILGALIDSMQVDHVKQMDMIFHQCKLLLASLYEVGPVHHFWQSKYIITKLGKAEKSSDCSLWGQIGSTRTSCCMIYTAVIGTWAHMDREDMHLESIRFFLFHTLWGFNVRLPWTWAWAPFWQARPLIWRDCLCPREI